jgi:hypothetical protein
MFIKKKLYLCYSYELDFDSEIYFDVYDVKNQFDKLKQVYYILIEFVQTFLNSQIILLKETFSFRCRVLKFIKKENSLRTYIYIYIYIY